MALIRDFGSRRTTAAILLLAALTGTAPGLAVAGEGASIEKCQVCHGPDGVSRWPDIPNISGLPEVVIANALYDFRGQTRPCRVAACGQAGNCPDESMCELGAALTATEIEQFARRYAAQAFSPSVAETAPDLVMQGAAVHEKYCEECHSAGGSDPSDEASILRGQNMDYLQNAMGDFYTRRRVDEEPMTLAFEQLNEQELEALLHFYASPAH